ncbi:MAG: tripartite tricarboxylate transporter substrate binding protein [Reyranella sp.]|uniref:Bug family tripartite tricarboxylate transporter substrate binding protein n=1 Tax=Reyranella sp. TaxID=1929291 RepID=UPI00272FDD8A|nr:tripartite tricarboxylate transporter substrate binding protein [Reyranella sp.]MDP1964466.1 tripartite tricarboxylate transporter substrate binding protein [Reyranella sp.]MDP2373566.1 tripartite tricarboxylate transporter substrate binding protein [Reyranella sp.]
MKIKSMAHVAALLAGLLLGLPAWSQAYPAKPVTIIVPYQAGQGTDVAARLFAEQLTKALGQQFIIDNKPGAGGNIGTAAAARSAGDGYTLLMGTVATQTMNEFLYSSVGYDSDKDFAPVILVGMLPMVISANPSFAPSTIPELVTAAKAQPDKLNIALPSTTARIVFELLKTRTGAPLFGVPYKGSATAMTEVMGGQVQLTIDTATASRGHVQSGKLKALAITTLKSSELLPGVKSVAEQGFPGFEVTAWNAIYAPRGTPKAIVDRLNAEVAKILAQPETRQRLMQLGFEPAGGSPEALAAYEKQERAKWGPLIKAAGLKGD